MKINFISIRVFLCSSVWYWLNITKRFLDGRHRKSKQMKICFSEKKIFFFSTEFYFEISFLLKKIFSFLWILLIIENSFRMIGNLQNLSNFFYINRESIKDQYLNPFLSKKTFIKTNKSVFLLISIFNKFLSPSISINLT